ncbi:MAG: hypothetical protein WBA74_06720 [Cyclobacteriaceae bacterium]
MTHSLTIINNLPPLVVVSAILILAVVLYAAIWAVLLILITYKRMRVLRRNELDNTLANDTEAKARLPDVRTST